MEWTNMKDFELLKQIENNILCGIDRLYVPMLINDIKQYASLKVEEESQKSIETIKKLRLERDKAHWLTAKDIEVSFERGKKEERELIIEREKNMQCLKCGINMHHLIMDQRLHIHLCSDCRLEEMQKITEQVTNE